jgi:hypothetical protein
MSQFIRLDDHNLIAADCIGAVRYASDRDRWLLFDRENKLLGQAIGSFNPLDLEPVTTVPAVAGEMATVLFVASISPTARNVMTSRW